MLDFLYYAKRRGTFRALVLDILLIPPSILISMLLVKDADNLTIILLIILWICIFILIFIKFRKTSINKYIINYVRNELNGNFHKTVYYNGLYQEEGESIRYACLAVMCDFYIAVCANKLQLMFRYKDETNLNYLIIEPVSFARFFDFVENKEYQIIK